MIFKRLPCEDGQGPWNAGLKGGWREIEIYRRLLPDGRFGAPILYASFRDDVRARYWLFLEDVGVQSLRGAEFDVWLAALRWMGGLHGTYFKREVDLRAQHCLAEHSSDWYYTIARLARESARSAGQRRLDRFDRLMGGFDAVVQVLVSEPRTLVHGDVLADNLMVSPEGRIRPIDWESAAIGLPAWDVGRLIAGWDVDRPAMIAAYLEELAKYSACPPTHGEFVRTIRYCDVAHALGYLAWFVEPHHRVTAIDEDLDALQAAMDALEREL
jgi:aminoglycoside/choline kinase family phosphotransferase